MGRQLTLELPDDLYEPLSKEADAVGKPLDEWILARLRPLAQRRELSEREREEAMKELMAFAGCVNSGNPNAADNEAIDSDLARAHGNTQEERPQMPNFEVVVSTILSKRSKKPVTELLTFHVPVKLPLNSMKKRASGWDCCFLP